ncbi:beta-mannosidase-like [Ornithodoros turicata]|uniref:beta-mannosidase-like n=1 Tax=Ornithodoros turicata TaxID=34597 RepID=UPI003138CB39
MMQSSLALACIVIAASWCRTLCLVLSLNGDWRVYNRNKSILFSGVVPGNVYTDLMRAKLIGDPYYRDNDEQYNWVGRENWTYTREFQLTDDIVSRHKIVLTAHGIDTVSNILVNDAQVGSTDNMFVRYVFDIKPYAKVGHNNITVELISPVLYARDQAKISSRRHVIPPECPPVRQRGECNVNQLRKSQVSFGWEFAPAFPTQGIWKHINVEYYNTLIIRDVTIRARSRHLSRWTLDVKLHLEVAFSATKSVMLNINFDDRLQLERNISITANDDMTSSYHFRLNMPDALNISTWWPNGYGEARTYLLSLTISRGKESDTARKRIAFRKVELVQEPIINGTGLTFLVRINNEAIFLKGSNWIPPDAFHDRVSQERLEALLDAALAANMNAIRVWGGGVYECDAFYSLADMKGILIWQDFMFASALYPASPTFLNSVAIEARQQVRRLQHHASIFLWCGNSEGELGMAYNWWRTTTEAHREDYIGLFRDTLEKIVTEEDPTRPYVGSSPSNGVLSKVSGGIHDNPNDGLSGDVHFFDYYSPPWSWESLPTPRFCSAFGFPSFPTLETLSTAFPAEDLVFPFPQAIENRMHLANARLDAYMSSVLNVPRADGSNAGFQIFVLISQIYQAMGTKSQVEHYRRSQLTLTRSQGLTMGALYFALNDVWPAPSWSSIDYQGYWKMLHYFAVHFFSPLLVSPYVDGSHLRVAVLDETYEDEPYHVILHVDVFSYESLQPRGYFSQILHVLSVAQVAYSRNLTELLTLSSCPRSSCFLLFKLVQPDTNETLSQNFLLLEPPRTAKDIQAARVHVTNTTEVTNDSLTDHTITLTTNHVALFVWLSSGRVRGRFSDNGFLMAQESVRVNFTSDFPVALDILLSNLTLTCLNCHSGSGYSPMSPIKIVEQCELLSFRGEAWGHILRSPCDIHHPGKHIILGSKCSKYCGPDTLIYSIRIKGAWKSFGTYIFSPLDMNILPS